MNADTAPPISRGRIAAAAMLYALFVVYGSLLPFDFHPRATADAVEAFRAIPYLKLGVASRADWVANILLYITLAFLATAAVAAGRRPWAATIGALGVAIGCLALAFAVEFAQLYFPPRTVSQNDLIAETIGTAIGIGLWFGAGPRLLRLWQVGGRTGAAGHRALLVLYLLGYLALSFFPYDLLVSASELQVKWSNADYVAWGVASSCGGVLSCSVKLATEVLVAVPIGALLALLAPSLRLPAALAIGLAIGAVIEGGQFLLASGISQGLSLVTRAAGVALGLALQRSARWDWLDRHSSLARTLVVVAAPLYLALLASLNGFGGSIESASVAAQKLAHAHFLPFYYHYFTSETAAMRSLLTIAVAYAPIGVAWWLLWPRGSSTCGAAAAAGAVALGIEALKLFVPGQKPDPTNVLIAVVAAWAANHVVRRSRQGSAATPAPRGTASVESALPRPVRQVLPAAAPDLPALQIRAAFAAGVIIVATWAAPGNPIAGAAALIAYVTCVWWQPVTAMFLFPVVLALTDVTTYSGPRWLDVLDAAMIATAALAFVRPRGTSAPGQPHLRLPPAIWLLLGLLPGSVIGLEGLSPADPNALLTPLGSGWGAMQFKAIVGAFVLVLFVVRQRLDPDGAGRMLGRGMIVALAGVTLMTIAERLAFVGPFDFSSDYRVPGPFSAIALGGAYIECFLVAATPFALVAAMRENHVALRWAAAALVVGTAYATMVTYSRGGQVVFVATVIAAAVLLSTHRFDRKGAGRAASGVSRGIAIAAGVTAVVGVILLAPYAVSRFATLGPDARVRLDHWTESLGFGKEGWLATTFGNGIGSFGHDAFILGEPATRPGIFSIVSEPGNTFVRANPGSLSYLDQRVEVEHAEPLTVSVRLRSSDASNIEVAICEKDLVQSRTCGSARLKVVADGRWHETRGPITLPRNPNAGWPPRPLRLTIFHGGKGIVDIDDIALVDSGGRSRIRNGDFEQGAAHWIYASDRHLTWHMKNLWLHVFYEFGIVGVLAHAGLLIAGVVGAWRAASAGQPYFLAVAISLLTFHGIGLIDSLIDAPRFILLYLSLALLGSVVGRQAAIHARDFAHGDNVQPGGMAAQRR